MSDDKIGVPLGNLHPSAWIMPQKPGMIASRGAELELTASGSALMGLPGVGASSISITIADAAGQLIVSGSGSVTITVTTNTPTLVSTLSGIGDATLSLSTNTPILGALAGGIASASISISGSLEPYATGSLAGFAKLAGDAVVEADYGGAVYLADYGTDGVEYPAGVATYPVKTLAAADALAARYGLRKYFVQGDYTMVENYSNVAFYGWGPLQFCKFDLNGVSLDTVSFSNMTLTGTLNADRVAGSGWQSSLAKVDFSGCYLHEISNLEGTLRDCQIDGATSVSPGGWISSSGTIIEGDYTVFDLQSTADTAVSMDIESGWAQFANAVDGCLIELNVKGGEVSLDASCTGGEYYIEGVGTLFNDSAMTKKENHLVWDEPTSYHTETGSTGKALTSAGSSGDPWATVLEGTYTAAEVIRIVAAAVAGKTSGAGGSTITFRDLADTTDRIVGTVDDDGNRTAVTLDGE
jgi:hypothetical protein